MRWIVLLLVAMTFAGCLDDAPDDLPVDPAAPPVAPSDPNVAPAQVGDKPLADYLHDISERVEGLATVTEQFRTAVPGLGEGVELDTWIIRPQVEGPVPVILEVTPYYTGGAPASLGRVGIELIERGYAVGVSSVRGTGNSGGCFSQGGPQEAKDTAAVIEHMAQQGWSNGNVGLMGVSYPGTTPQDVWVEAPPSLKTIVPISGISDMYRYNFVHAVPINPQGPAFNTYYWVLEGPATFDPSDTATVPGAVAGEVCEDQVFVQEGGLTSGVDGNKDAYWQVRDFGAEYLDDSRDVERASVFYIHGLQDWNVKTHMMEDWVDLLWDSHVPMKMWLGQWGHAWPASTSTANVCTSDDEERGPACRADWWNQTLIAWFDQFLKEKDTGILDAPRVQVQDDQGRWRHEHIWPPRDTQELVFHLATGALQETPGTGTGQYALVPLGQTSVDTTVPGSITFVSEPLAQDITISGLPHFIGNVTASGARASLIMSLGERGASSDRSINFGVWSLNHNDDFASGVTSVADQRIAVDVPFFPQDDVIHAGNQILLTFASNTAGSPGPSLIPAHTPGTMTVDFAGAKLVLPIDVSLEYESRQPYESS